MCGIVGFFSSRNQEDHLPIRNMMSMLTHRGPDDEGVWNNGGGVQFGFRRLSILDLSEHGHQPMQSESSRYVIVFNGEIYNFAVLRAELEGLGASFRGHSDTEVLLAAFDRWGIEASLKKVVGMFAIAVWDEKEEALTLARDRLGEKPLYYGWNNGYFFFASELKPFRAHPDARLEIDRDAIALFMRYCYIPCPHSVFKGIYKLFAGSMLTLSRAHLNQLPESFSPFPEDDHCSLRPVRYWSLQHIVESNLSEPSTLPDVEATELLESLLREAVSLQMVADVPVGAFLSGGVDSSTIVALMQSVSRRPIKTYSIGFDSEEHDESSFARQVAWHLGTEHTEMRVQPSQAMEVIPRLPLLYDEPFGDSSQIPTFLVSQLARQEVTVSLSGDGGDELFGGYNRYIWGRKVWNYFLSPVPGPLRRMASKMIEQFSGESWERVQRVLALIVPRIGRIQSFGYKMSRLADVIRLRDMQEFLNQSVSHCTAPQQLVLASSEPLCLLRDRRQSLACKDIATFMMYLDALTYLVDDILVKVDRATMGVSLESRMPLLDHRVVEFAWSLPMDQRIRSGQTKWLLRQVLYKHVPRHLIERPKQGFSIPLAVWLRGPLRGWAEELLSAQRLEKDGFLNPTMVRELWNQHLSGRHNWEYCIWNILMFQSWLGVHQGAWTSEATDLHLPTIH